MTDEAMSPLRRRMIEDMTIRKLAPKTQHDYVQRVKNFAAFLGRSPDRASFEDVRRYQLHLAASGASVATRNQTVATLRFFFRVTLKQTPIIEHTQFIHEAHKLPVVLSPEEVARLLDAAPGLKYKAALSVAYGAGLRAAEVVSLKVCDIRSYGLFANGSRAENIARVRELLTALAPQNQTDDAAGPDEPPALPHPCPCCGGRMIIIETFEPGCSPRAHPINTIRIDTS